MKTHWDRKSGTQLHICICDFFMTQETFASNPATARQFDGVMRICPLGKMEMYAAEQPFGVIMLETEAQEACNLSEQRGNKPDKFGLGHAK
ncbi:hypothetical protein T02_12392 [Trichinella nativa]|uniref:Uncharacterized protein n=1 Tax=Trichinella nativa TaxID=6335 RepID=A0A0V1L1S6_9BILA|nr:hypothetical protein T02_12392 [Trichinella nativa]